ncbi:hypothetical protein FE257_000099 [Aspergillus nanangensis]|uniref:Uncharacterized protein n=1 Tax=Aspergillus nanangensis TaxID=2582783 RepID=A0AAD4GZL5_ASPNN|nr:hypothetical protein FE257_000099 [Aspergillus nanangensis]
MSGLWHKAEDAFHSHHPHHQSTTQQIPTSQTRSATDPGEGTISRQKNASHVHRPARKKKTMPTSLLVKSMIML